MPTELMAPTRSVNLIETEEYLAALLETEEGGVSSEMIAEFEAELSRALAGALDKRERVGQFILAAEAAAQFRRSEARRMTESARVLENAAERVRNYVACYIGALPLDAKGKRPKLQGHTVTMSTRACPAALHIEDEKAVPNEFLKLSITMSVTVWNRLMEAVGCYAPRELSSIDRSVSIDVPAVRKAIEAGHEVPGADLITGKLSLTVK